MPNQASCSGGELMNVVVGLRQAFGLAVPGRDAGEQAGEHDDDEHDECHHRHAIAPVVTQCQSERRERLAADTFGLVAKLEAGEIGVGVVGDRLGDVGA